MKLTRTHNRLAVSVSIRTLLVLLLVVGTAVHVHNKYGIKNAAHSVQTSVQAAINRLTTTTGSTVSKDARRSLHKATHSIVQKTKFDGAGCSATAIGKHALMTAEHCQLPPEELYIDNPTMADAMKADAKPSARIERTIRDGNEHTIYLLSGISFTDIANVVEDTDFEPGFRVFNYGNPASLRDQYREGYFTGYDDFEGRDGSKCHCLLFDMNLTHGDSGSGVFDMNGNLVAVESYGNVLDAATKFVGMFPLKFTKSQLAEAKNF